MIQHHIEITYIMWYSTNWLDVGGVYTRGSIIAVVVIYIAIVVFMIIVF